MARDYRRATSGGNLVNGNICSWKSAFYGLATLPRQAEWEAYVSQFQGCDANATSAEKWLLMDKIFDSEK